MAVGFWNKERLAELVILWDTHSIPMLALHFKRSPIAIENAYKFAIQHKKLKITSQKKGKKRVTVYAPAYAEGAANNRNTAGKTY